MNADLSPSLSAEAWLISLGNELFAAVGWRELQHIVHSPINHTIPLCPSYCDKVLIWNDQLLPVVDLASLLTEGRKTCQDTLVGILAYRGNDAHTVYYAGLRLHGPPKRLKVYDNQACALPEDMPAWEDIAVSCFSYQNDRPVPILDLKRIFSESLQAVV